MDIDRHELARFRGGPFTEPTENSFSRRKMISISSVDDYLSCRESECQSHAIKIKNNR
jgi:hypothetical protein